MSSSTKTSGGEASNERTEAPETTKNDLYECVAEVEDELGLVVLSGQIEDELLKASLAEYQVYLDTLESAKAHIDTLLASTSETLDQLNEISATFCTIDSQAQALHEQSNGILEEQKRTEKLAADVAENLQYYEPLERLSRRLNAPGAGALVRKNNAEFADILSTLDACIEYMERHIDNHKEASTYRSRYRLLLTRALTLVRNSFMNSVRETTAEVAKRIADKQLNDTTMSALLYAKFRVDAADMKSL